MRQPTGAISPEMRRELLVKQALIDYRRAVEVADIRFRWECGERVEHLVAYGMVSGWLWEYLTERMNAQDERMVALERPLRDPRNEDWSGWDGYPPAGATSPQEEYPE